MKKTLLPLLLVLALGLGGCGHSRELARFEAFSEELRSGGALTMTAGVRGESEDSTLRFTLSYRDEPGGGCCVEVLEPEIIRGVRARMSGDGTRLLYDSVAIDTGDDGDTGLSPMGALPLLARSLRGGCVDSVWKEDGCLAVKLAAEDGVDVTVLFDDGMRPAYAEIAHEGKTVLFVDITEFAF